MAATDDLNNAVTALATGFAALDSVVQQQLKAVVTAANQTDPDTAAIEQAVTNISAVTSKMAADAASLTAQIPAATTVPAPAPSPTPVAVASPAPTVAVPVIPTPIITAPAATPTSTPPASATTTATAAVKA